jgi:aminoglycoside phosphotransferase (APT) family kinase protein
MKWACRASYAENQRVACCDAAGEGISAPATCEYSSMESLPNVDRELVHALIASQFPQWAGLPLEPVTPGGWDNRTFRLGDSMLVRLPSAAAYAAQAEKEQCWLPRLEPYLPHEIPLPVGLGFPELGYPWKWSVLRWIDGRPLAAGAVADLRIFAADLGRFLIALHAIDAAGGPLAGAHSFHRGGLLATYDAAVGQD